MWCFSGAGGVGIPAAAIQSSCAKHFLQKSKRCRDGQMKLLANKVHIQGMKVLLAVKVHKQEPQRKWLLFTQPSLHK